jgi:hypothetical protein
VNTLCEFPDDGMSLGDFRSESSGLLRPIPPGSAAAGTGDASGQVELPPAGRDHPCEARGARPAKGPQMSGDSDQSAPVMGRSRNGSIRGLCASLNLSVNAGTGQRPWQGPLRQVPCGREVTKVATLGRADRTRVIDWRAADQVEQSGPLVPRGAVLPAVAIEVHRFGLSLWGDRDAG